MKNKRQFILSEIFYYYFIKFKMYLFEFKINSPKINNNITYEIYDDIISNILE